MIVEVGRTYMARKSGGDVTVGEVVTITKVSDRDYITFVKDDTQEELLAPLKIFKEHFMEVEVTIDKPAHYDTAIDTIDFMKANFSREAVEGFMRGNAIKYLQRIGKGEKLSDLKKAEAYIKMLIELEEGE